MLGFIGLLLVVWLVLVLLGIFIKGLIWLLVLGAVLFVITGLYGFIRREALGRRR